MNRIHKIISALLAVFLLLGILPVTTVRAAEASEGLQITASAPSAGGMVPVVSLNDGAHSYYFYAANPIGAALAQEEGGFLRVEQIEDSVIAERYTNGFTLQSRKTIPMELPIFGGIYLCDDYNFLVFGQTNHEEDNNKEVIRVVRYSKNWERQAAASLCGANTTIPFDAGSLRFARYGDLLYIRTCHEMYTSSDGLNHQANLTMSVRISDMTVTDRHCEVANAGAGYVSHSFNQFILVDGRNLVAVDHGDAYPRSVVLIKCRKPAGLEIFTGSSLFLDVLPIAEVSGNYHYNTTGVEVGGFESSETHYLVAGITCDQSGTADQSSAQKNVFITATPKDNFSEAGTELYYLTDYAEGARADITNPYLVKVSGNQFCVLWTLGDQLNVRMIDGAGKPITDTVSMTGRLSDCPPIVADGKIVWYVCGEGWYQSAPVFYQLDWEAVDFAPVSPEPEPPETEPSEIVASGTCGEQLTWTLDSAGTLRISGTGDMSTDRSSGSRWFTEWDQAQSLILEEGVTGIGEFAFAYCASLGSVTIPDSVTSIAHHAFAHCTRLSSITIPKNVEFIEEQVFAHCASLSSIRVAEENTHFSSDEHGALFNKDKTKLLAAPGAISEYSIPDGVISIERNAFEGCSQLLSVEIPDSVTSIGFLAFYDCASLPQVELPDSISEISPYAFWECTNLSSIEIPGSVSTIGWNAFENCTNLNNVVLGEGVTTIEAHTFANCSRLTGVTLPDSVIDIKDGAFQNCENLTDVYYSGTEENREEMNISTRDNEALENARWHYNSIGPEEETEPTEPAPSDPVHFHVYVESIVAPTCTEEGYHSFQCSCGDGYRENTSPALGHDWDEGEIIREATEEEEGIQSFTCRRCDETKTESIPKLEHTHDYTAVVTPPSCLEEGYTTYTCACGHSYTGNTVNAIGYHAWDDGTVTLAPTEDEEGIITYTCMACGETFTDVIDRLEHEHSYTVVVTAPTCTEEGYTTYTCACGESYTDDEVPALGHDWDNGVVTRQPTENTEGIRTYTCEVCDETRTEAIPTLEHEHSYTVVVTAPTCTEEGYTAYTCACGESYTDDEVPALGHDWDDGVVTRQPTENTEGIRTYTCEVCDETRTEAIPTLEHEHSYTVVVTAPTCTEGGYTAYTCACGESYTDDEVPALGHDWDDGVVTRQPTENTEGIRTYTCEICEATKTEVIPILEPEPTDPVNLPVVGSWTADLVLAAADLGISAPDSVIRATFTFEEGGTASTTWQAVDLTALRIYFRQMFVNAYYAMAYGAGITDILEIEQFCMDSTGLSVSDYMNTIVTPEAIETAFTPPSTTGVYRLNESRNGLYTDMAIMGVPSDPDVENSFVIGNDTMYLNAASYGKPEYTFVCSRRPERTNED